MSWKQHKKEATFTNPYPKKQYFSFYHCLGSRQIIYFDTFLSSQRIIASWLFSGLSSNDTCPDDTTSILVIPFSPLLLVVSRPITIKRSNITINGCHHIVKPPCQMDWERVEYLWMPLVEFIRCKSASLEYICRLASTAPSSPNLAG